MTARNVLMLVTLALCARAHGQVATEGQPTLGFETRVVPASQFITRRLIAIGELEERKRPGLLSIWFTTSRAERALLLSRIVGMGDQPYRSWETDYEDRRSHKWKVARFLAWNGSAVFQMLDESNMVCRRVVHGSDFLTIAEDGVFADVVDFSLTGVHPVPALEILARTNGTLDAKTVLKIWDRFSSVQAGSISVDLRRDPWFMFNIHAMVFNPFELNMRAPSEDVARKLQSVSCSGRPDSIPTCVCRIGERPQNDLNACQH